MSRHRRSRHGWSSTSAIAAIAGSAHKASRAFPRTRPSAPSSSTIAKSTASPTTARSSTSCAPERSTTKRKGDKRFAPLADFLEHVPTDCPHELFSGEGNSKARASQAGATFADTTHAIVNIRENAATETAALIIPAVGNNKLRHETLQRFMLANDSVTLAVEIPIWLRESDIAAIEARWGISLAPKVSEGERVITGHIDFLQVRNGAVHLLDYKPDATTNKPFAQLTIYALALSHLTGIPLFDFKCAWFNEHQYCEFFPRTILARNTGSPRNSRAA